MGSIDEVSEALGEIKATLKAMERRQEEACKRMEDLMENGCPRGKSNTHRLDELTASHRKEGALAGGIVGVLAAIGAKVVDLFSK